MNKKIEDLFKDGFAGFEENPSEGLWNKIHEKRQAQFENEFHENEEPEHTFSKAFVQYNEVPTEKVWNNVQSHLYRRRKKRRALYFGIFALFISCLGLTSLYYYNGKESENESKSTLSQTLLSENNQSNLKYNNNNNQVNENHQITKPVLKSELKYTLDSKVKTNTYTQKNQIAVESKENNIQKVTSSTSLVNGRSLPNPIRQSQSLSTQQGNDQFIQPNNNLNLSQENWTIENHPAVIDSLAITIDQKSQVHEKKIEEKKKVEEKKLSAKKYKWRGPNYFMYTSETDMNNEESRWKFGISAGYEFPKSSVKSSDSDQLYAQFRNQDEQRTLSYNIQFFASRQLGKLFVVQSGFGYNSYGFKGSYNHSIYNVTKTYLPNGNIQYDTNYSYKLNSNSQYRLNYLELPIIFGFRFGDYRLNYQLKAGYIFQILASQSGAALSPQTHQVENLGSVHQISTNAFGASLYSGICINYQIKHELSYFLEPAFRYNISPMLNGNNAKQYINSWGINMGVKFHWD